MDDRINELETLAAFQEKTIEDLNEALRSQQEQLDKLEEELLRVNKLLKKILMQFEHGQA